MALPRVEDIWNDPDFQGLPPEEKRKVLLEIDADFKGLPRAEQDQVVGINLVSGGSVTRGTVEESPSFFEIEKQPGTPRTPLDLVKQVARQYKEAALSPMPGSILTTPVRALQENAQQMGSEVARGAQPRIGTGPARVAGFLTSMAADPTSYMGGVARFGKAAIAPENRMAVNAAREAGIPTEQLTRAEVTGGRLPASIESALEKTLTGSQPIAENRAMKAAKLDEFTRGLSNQFGSNAGPGEVGNIVKLGIDDVQGATKRMAQDIYAKVPNLPVNLGTLSRVSDDILREQSRLPKGNQNSSLVELASQYQSLANKAVKFVENWGRSNYSKPIEEAPVSLDTLRSIQSDLGSKLNELKRTGAGVQSPAYRGYSRLIAAIDSDIEALSSSPDALTKYLGKEAADKLTKANSLWKAMKEIDDNKLVRSIRLASPEDAADKIFSGGRASDVLTARAAMSEDSFKAAKQHYFSQLISDPKLETKIKKEDPAFFQAVFTRSELDAIYKKIALSKLLGAAERIGANQGSSRSNLAVAQGAGVLSGLTTALTGALTLNPIVAGGGLATAAGSYFGPRALANAYLKYGVKGIPIKARAPGAGQIAHRVDKALSPAERLVSLAKKKRGSR